MSDRQDDLVIATVAARHDRLLSALLTGPGPARVAWSALLEASALGLVLTAAAAALCFLAASVGVSLQ